MSFFLNSVGGGKVTIAQSGEEEEEEERLQRRVICEFWQSHPAGGTKPTSLCFWERLRSAPPRLPRREIANPVCVCVSDLRCCNEFNGDFRMARATQQSGPHHCQVAERKGTRKRTGFWPTKPPEMSACCALVCLFLSPASADFCCRQKLFTPGTVPSDNMRAREAIRG